jgi:hypothetical protein
MSMRLEKIFPRYSYPVLSCHATATATGAAGGFSIGSILPQPGETACSCGSALPPLTSNPGQSGGVHSLALCVAGIILEKTSDTNRPKSQVPKT